MVKKSNQAKKLNLKNLLLSTSSTAFYKDYWHKQHLFCKQQKNLWLNYFSLQEFEEVLNTRTFEFDHQLELFAAGLPLKINSSNSNYVKLLSTHGPTGQSSASYRHEIAALIKEQRASVKIFNIHTHVKKLDKLAQEFSQIFSQRVSMNLYYTPENGKCLPRHVDAHDIFVLQVEGSKHWTIYKEGSAEHFVMKAGDVLYLPKSLSHEAHCKNESSLHLTVGVYPYLLRDIVIDLMKNDPSVSQLGMSELNSDMAGIKKHLKAFGAALAKAQGALPTDNNELDFAIDLTALGADSLTPDSIMTWTAKNIHIKSDLEGLWLKSDGPSLFLGGPSNGTKTSQVKKHESIYLAHLKKLTTMKSFSALDFLDPANGLNWGGARDLLGKLLAAKLIVHKSN